MTVVGVPQHMAALERANHHRFARAELKRQLKADPYLCAPLRVAHLLCLPERPEWLEGMRIFDLVGAIPRFGRARTLRLLADAGVAERRTVGKATVRQRQAVADALDRASIVRGAGRRSDWDRLPRSRRMAFERQLRAERVG